VKGFTIEQKLGRKIAKNSFKILIFNSIQQQYIGSTPKTNFLLLTNCFFPFLFIYQFAFKFCALLMNILEMLANSFPYFG